MPDFKGRVVGVYNWAILRRVFSEHDMSVFLHGGSGIANWPTVSYRRYNQPILYDPQEEEPYYAFDADFALGTDGWMCPRVICPSSICATAMYRRLIVVQRPWILIEEWYIAQQKQSSSSTSSNNNNNVANGDNSGSDEE